MDDRKKAIAVFGSSQPGPGDPDYAAAQELGRLLGKAGYTVVTGGYSGIMEAASRGANEAGALVIGVTAAQIEAYGPFKANQWVTREIKYPTLTERLLHLITRPDGFVVMAGGIGTLSEMLLAWSFVKVGEVSRKPIICVGQDWARILSVLKVHKYISLADRELVSFADTPAQVIEMLSSAWIKERAE